MRTTITLDDDVAAALEQVRQTEGIGLSEAVNRLVRASLSRPRPISPYHHRSRPIGLKVDVTNIGDVLDLLDDG